MNVVMIGTGYVGLVSGTCFAEMGHKVTCIDINQDKINLLKEGKSPIYEPGLNELLKRNIEAERLSFSTGYDSVENADFVFLGVQTPAGDDGRANLEYLLAATKSVCQYINSDTVFVIKSTVPVGTHKEVKRVIEENTAAICSVVNNPEFLKEGSAVDDFMRPDRIVVGFDSKRAGDMMDDLYAPLVRQGYPLIKMSNLSAEMAKYAANCFLATKISFINEIANLCDLTGADIEEVRKGITSDRRIGTHFLYPGPGYGGSCFPKDVKALMHTASQHGQELEIVKAADEINDRQKVLMAKKIDKHFAGDISGKTFAFWGVAFKPNTDDIRESAAIFMAEELVSKGAKIRYYDPVADNNYEKTMSHLGSSLTKVEDEYDCLEGCDALVILTEWPEFRSPKFDLIREKLGDALIFDARNLFNTSRVIEKGFKYYAIGKNVGVHT